MHNKHLTTQLHYIKYLNETYFQALGVFFQLQDMFLPHLAIGLLAVG